MAKNEKWLTDVFPGRQKLVSAYIHLTPRELSIVAVAVLDSALSEILLRRLNRRPKEAADFLGLNGDGRAPAATFGARIQLAFLLGILTERDAKILRLLKEIRNRFAHNVRIDANSPEIAKLLTRLLEEYDERHIEFVQEKFVRQETVNSKGEKVALKEVPRFCDFFSENSFLANPGVGKNFLQSVFFQYQAYFHEIVGQTPQIETLGFVPPSKGLRFDRIVDLTS